MWEMFTDTIKAWPGKIWRGFKDKVRNITGSTWKTISLVVFGAILLYYPIGMVIVNKIDDQDNFQPPLEFQSPEGSASVSKIVGLIDREVNQHGWVMNDPIFKPGWFLDNMPNFQQGMFSAFTRFSMELRDQIGRTRGTSASDVDLEEAAGLLPYPGDVWIFNFSTSLLPTASAERQYLKAMEALQKYNKRLATGDAVFERRGDNLMATLDRIALDLGSSSAAIDNQLSESSNDWIDTTADDLFYNIKGQTYGYYQILQGLRVDFVQLINSRELGPVFDQMLKSFEEINKLDPWFVVNGEIDGQILPNHLIAQGFYLLRARAQLREITKILLK